MASTHSLKRLAEKFEKPTELQNLPTKSHELLLSIENRVWMFLKSPNKDELARIIKHLDDLKALIEWLDKWQLIKLLNNIQERDKIRWRNYSWERIELNNPAYHENNKEWKYAIKWITADAIIAIAKQYLDPKESRRQLIINIAKVYWLTSEILRSQL
jgi:hypothetical protein